jgi:2,3-bisphosphoglycerate-independent phosphoglycerate mutase
MKYILVVLDGAGDRGDKTPLQVADKPNMDSLSSAGKNGLLDLGYRKEVNSDVGFLTLLSCYSKSKYPGRGYIETLGVNILPGKKDICIRGNFATLDSRGNVRDRRAGRDETGLRELAGRLDGMEIDGVGFTVKKSTGHRVIVVASGPNLSDRVRPNDPMKTGVPLPQVAARSPQARFTASVLNKFIYRANRILSGHPVNRRRELPANTILFRNLGMKGEVDGFEERFGLRACCVAGINVARGVARFLDMDVIEVRGATGMPDTNLAGKRKAALKALKNHDFVFLHINGTDILAHDRDRPGKARFIERVDRELGRLLEGVNLEETCIVVTCDHRTVSLPRSEYKGYEHVTDPVPIVISGDGIKPDEVKSFDEQSVRRGSLKMSGNELVPLLLMLTKKR